MTLCLNRFLVVLCVAHAVYVSAIYDPRATTTKPPERRESVLPWHSPDRGNASPTETRSPQSLPAEAQTSPRPTTSWTPWRKSEGSELEHRTQIDIKDHVPEEAPKLAPGQRRKFEPNKWQQQENVEPPPPEQSTESSKSRKDFVDEPKYDNRGPSRNMIDLERKDSPKLDVTRDTDEAIEFEDVYEGVSVDSTKPRKEYILYPRRPQHKVARYDARTGVQCPDRNSTGQFVYPPDCKFFVNCWKGRAIVQPCAPGTHFNPDTLECDFPHKVKCYESSAADFRQPTYAESQDDLKPQRLQEPKCSDYLTGLLPYHGDCTKFLQCANGATYIMNCGPGTVFNPSVGVCDWPHHVKGCEDTFNSNGKDILPYTPPNPYSHGKEKSEYIKKVACPTDITGLLPHPETCKKFLQCANGVTHVMDCGPGTVFNPITTVCDWPYNVPGCKTEKTDNGKYGTESNTRSPFSGVGGTTWSNSDRYGPTDSSLGYESRLGYTTASSISRPTWKPFTTTSSPRWVPTWTTSKPPYAHSGHTTNYHDRYDRLHEEDSYKDHEPHRSGWKPITGRPYDGDYGSKGHRDREWTKTKETDQNPQGTYHHFDRAEESWLPERDSPYDRHGYHLPGRHYHHHHHHHYHGYGPLSGSSANPNWDSASPVTPDDPKYDQQYYGRFTPRVSDDSWRPDRYRHHDPYHRHYEHAEPTDDTDPRQTQPYYPAGRHGEDDVQFRENKTRLDGSSSAERRGGQDFSPDRQDRNRTFIGYHFLGSNRTSSHAGNVFPSGRDKLAENRNQTRHGSWQDGLSSSPRTEQGSAARSQPGESVFRPSTWRGQQSREQAQTGGRQADPWDQGGMTREDKIHRWQSSSDVYQQSTADKEADAKMAQWASRTNVLSNAKGQAGLDPKNATQHPRAKFYPSGIYVNANGVRGHYITKEIEDDRGSSRSRGPFRAQKPVSRSDASYNTTGGDRAPFLNFTTTTERIPRGRPSSPARHPGRDRANITGTKSRSFRSDDGPAVWIEGQDDYSSEDRITDTRISEVFPEFVDPFRPEIDERVDVLDKNEWKPRLVFENKTETTTAPSVVMRIGPKKLDVDLFNVEAAPFKEAEPPFPVYYVQPVRPLSHSQKIIHPTPISGQVIRLRGGTGPSNGYVEVQGTQPGWGAVCDSRNDWTLKEAHIVCRQLGYVRGAEMVWQGRNNHTGVPTWIAANRVTCLGNETRFQSCKFTHGQDCYIQRDAIAVRCVPNRIAHCREDEIPHEGQCYYLAGPDRGVNHAEALEYCTRRNARLIDITSQAENNFVSEWLLQSHPEATSIMTAGIGFTTMNRPLWLWEDSARAKFKFTKWWPGWMNDTKQPPWVGSRPHCIVMKRKFPCHERVESTCVTDYFFWDAEDCATSSRGHAFVCERLYDDIGCVYGNGNQYAGKANVTLSGKDCLPWADERVAHPLRVNVVNEEIRGKLQMHNFCRNPNPHMQSRPWCFVGPAGEFEYCDIPSCGNIDPKRSTLTGQCESKHFECTPGECIPSPWVCDGEEDCTNGADERNCLVDLSLFEKSTRHKLEGYDVEKWLNTPLKTCAFRCKEAAFTCRSFNHKATENVCLLSDGNVGLTGALKPDEQFNYYEVRERSVNCVGMYTCNNHKCINQSQVCDGKNDCNDRSDESICTAESLDYGIRLAGSNNSHEGRVEVKIIGYWGQVCDDGFGMINADVICRELGFVLGALEVRPGGFYGNLDPPTRFMVDQLKCRGNETTLRECDFNGWGVHNCQPEEAVGIVCKTAVDTCQDGHWKCDNSPTCIPIQFICDEVVDCPDHSDESPEHCDAPFEVRLANGSSPMEGRVEVRHHGVWGTVCDDDFTVTTATVTCRSLGYGGVAIAKKSGFFGPGKGPIWLDEVFCHGNETQLYKCEHNHWGQHNCDHNEDAGVICSPGDVNDTERYWLKSPELSRKSIDEILPTDCGRRAKDFNDDEDMIFAKVLHGSVAQKGTYPWQASIRVRGHSRSNHWCGAVIISPLHVLTAAHCLEGYNKGTYFVRAGDYNTDIEEGTEVEANIEDYYVHEEFRKGHKMNNDIALVLLKGRGIPLGKNIMPICLPPENTEYSPGLNCTISGFGSIGTGRTSESKDLRYGWVPLLDQSICRAGYVYGEGAISDGMMCAGYLDEGIDTCDGDSGGPLACYRNGAFTLYGITSWGQHCGLANKPGVYVRVAYYRRWINQKILESVAGI